MHDAHDLYVPWHAGVLVSVTWLLTSASAENAVLDSIQIFRACGSCRGSGVRPKVWVGSCGGLLCLLACKQVCAMVSYTALICVFLNIMTRTVYPFSVTF